MGDWGLGIAPNPQSPIPNPQSPIPNPHLNNILFLLYIIKYAIKNIIYEKIIINYNKIYYNNTKS